MEAKDYKISILLKIEAISDTKIRENYFTKEGDNGYIELSPLLLETLNDMLRYCSDFEFSTLQSKTWYGLYVNNRKITSENMPKRCSKISHQNFFIHYKDKFDEFVKTEKDKNSFSLLPLELKIHHSQLFQDLLLAWMVLGSNIELKRTLTSEYFSNIVRVALKDKSIAEEVKDFQAPLNAIPNTDI